MNSVDSTKHNIFGFRDEIGNACGPNDVQQKFIDALRELGVFYGVAEGGTRSGKTSDCVYYSILCGLERPGLEVILSHVDHATLNSSLVFHTEQQIPEYTVDEKGKKTQCRFTDHKNGEITVRVPGLLHSSKGYTIKYYLRPLDPTKHLPEKLATSGLQCGLAIIDQVEKLSAGAFRSVVPRVTQWPHQILMTMNPDPTCFLYQEVIQRKWKDDLENGITAEEKASQWRVVKMNPADNPHLDPTYIRRLRRILPREWQRRFIEGIYETMDGLVLPAWDDEKHLFQMEYPIPSSWIVFEYLDPGGMMRESDPHAVGWIGVDPLNCCHLLQTMTIHNASDFDLGRIICEEREKLLMRDRRKDARIPIFMRTIADPAVGKRDPKSQRTQADMISEYVHRSNIYELDRMQCIPVQATAKGLPQKAINKTRAGLINDLLSANPVQWKVAGEVSSDGVYVGPCSDWIEQRKKWVSQDGEPRFPRTRNADGTVQDHMDHMAGSGYFASWFTMNYVAGSQPQERKRRGYSDMQERTLGEGFNPLSRFRKQYVS
jgi:hypothetical protein